MLKAVIMFLLEIAKTEVAKEAIGYSVNKLLKSTDDGITKDVAKVMIEGIAKSQANPTSYSTFGAALKQLKGE